MMVVEPWEPSFRESIGASGILQIVEPMREFSKDCPGSPDVTFMAELSDFPSGVDSVQV